MKEPVIASDGQSYEKQQILSWLEKNDSSPLTGEKLENKEIKDNFALKRIITDFIETQKLIKENLIKE